MFVTFSAAIAIVTSSGYGEGDHDLETSSLLKRVIGGELIERGKWPWLGSLTGTIPTKKTFGITLESRKLYCGASLIRPNWAISAAHCFSESDLPYVCLYYCSSHRITFTVYRFIWMIRRPSIVYLHHHTQ